MNNKYRNGKIYKLYSKSTGLTYYGSTTKKLEQRMSEHYSRYKAFQEDKHDTYFTSFEVLHQDDCIIECVLLYPCNNRQELELKEGYYIRNNECVNKHIPGRTEKEYREDNKERLSKYQAKYYHDNKERIVKQNTKYYQDNKERIAKRNNEKFTCSCGGKYTRSHKSQHMKSKKHLNSLK